MPIKYDRVKAKIFKRRLSRTKLLQKIRYEGSDQEIPSVIKLDKIIERNDRYLVGTLKIRKLYA